MNAYYFSRPIVTQTAHVEEPEVPGTPGKRVITITYVHVVHPINIAPGTTISAGDGWINVHKDGQVYHINIDDILYIGKAPTTKHELEALSTSETVHVDKWEIDVHYKTVYVSEDSPYAKSEHTVRYVTFDGILNTATKYFLGAQCNTRYTLEAIRSYILNELEKELNKTGRGPLKGNLYITSEGQTVSISFDDDMFESIGHMLSV